MTTPQVETVYVKIVNDMNESLQSISLVIFLVCKKLEFILSRKRHLVCVNLQGSHSDWKTWKNEKVFSSRGKVREF